MEKPDYKAINKKQISWFKKHKVLTTLGIVFFFLILGTLASSEERDPSQQQQQSNGETASGTATTVRIGEAARDGQFEFVVHSIKCGEKTVGSEFLNETAQGHFCKLNISVKNIGDRAQSLFAENQYLLDKSNRKFSANSTATSYASNNNETWYTEVNPGNSVTGDIYFDVPVDVEIVLAELHDSALSGGIKVQLK